MATKTASIGNLIAGGTPTITNVAGSSPGPYTVTVNIATASAEVGDNFLDDDLTRNYLISAISADGLTYTLVDKQTPQGPPGGSSSSVISRSFTSISAWEAVVSTWVGAGDTWVGELHEEGVMPLSEAPLTVNDTTVGTTGTLKITVKSGEWHQATPGGGFRWTTSTADWMMTLNVPEASCPTIIVERLEIIGKTATTIHHYGIAVNEDGAGAQKTTLRNIIIRDMNTNSGTAKNAYGVYVLGGADSGVKVENVACYNVLKTGGTGVARGFVVEGDNCLLSNCVAYNITTNGFFESGTTTRPTAKNCASISTGTCYAGTWNTASTHNCSGDTTAPDNGGVNPSQESAVATTEWTDPVNGDFTIKSSSVKILDNGTDLSGAFTDDIAGLIRMGVWDIGASQGSAASGFLLPSLGGVLIDLGGAGL